ncbi:MAG: YihY/virulence factor BrkB family protein, partial [Oscillospiraceae bacterium]
MSKEKLGKFFTIAKDRFVGADVGNTSVLITYYLLLSLAPLVIAVGNILPFLNIDPTSVMGYLDTVVPEAVLPILEPIVSGLLTNGSGGLLSLGLIAAIWSSSRGIRYLQKGMNKAYGIPDTASFIAKRLVSLVTILLILLLLIAFVVVFSMGEALLQGLAPILPQAGQLMHTLLDLKWPVAIGFLFCMLLIVYRVTPDVKLRFRDVLPGVFLALVGLLALVQGFTIYMRFATRNLSSYGTLGALFLLMFWLNFTVTLVLVGAVLNASIREYRFGKAEEEQGGVDRVISKTRDTLAARLRQWVAKKR